MTADTLTAEEKLCDGVEAVKGFCYVGNRLYANDVSKVPLTARTRIGWDIVSE